MPQLLLSRIALLATGCCAAAAFPMTAGAATAPLRGIDTAATWVTGDVNGDGLADLTGRPGNGLGVTFATATTDVRRAPSGPGLDLVASAGETLGAVADTGDFDGDGRADLLVSAQRGGSALVYVVHGAAAAGTVTVAAGPRVTAIGIAMPFQFGVAPRFAGDFNGDGKADVVVGRQTGSNVSATGWSGGFAVVLGGAPGATINANATSARVSLINTHRSCRWVFTSYLCGASALEVDPVGDVSGDGRADLFVEGASAARRYTLLGRTTTATFAAATLPASAVRPPAYVAVSRAFAEPAGDVNGDGVGDFTVLSRVADTGTGPQQRLVILGTRATSGTATAGAALVSSGEVGVAKLVHDLTGDGRSDLIVMTKTGETTGIDDEDPASWIGGLFRIHARIAAIPASGGTVDLDQAPFVAGLAEAGFTSNTGSIYGLRVADVEGDTRPELGLTLDGQLLLASTTGTDRLGADLFSAADTGLAGVGLPNAAIDPATGAKRALRIREAGSITLEYRRADGSIAGTETRNLTTGITLDLWRATVAGATLPAGTYTLRATPRDTAGNAGMTQTQQVVIAGGDNDPATLEVQPRFTNPDGSLLAGSGASYRLGCPTDQDLNGEWFAADNGISTRFDLSELSTPPVAGTSCVLRFNYLTYDKEPGQCSARPTTVTVNGQTIDSSTSQFAFALQPGANRIVHERGCTAPVFDGSRPVPGLTDREWVGNGSTTGSLVLTNGPNQVGGKVYPYPIDPNRRTVEFKVTMANGNGQAEGIALSFLKPKSGADYGGFPGTGGGALGVGGLEGTIIGIDQRQGPGDTRSSGVGIADGASATGLNWLATADPGQLLRGRGAIPIRVVSTGTAVSIYVNGSLRLTRAMTLPSPAFVAVSGSTSSIWQNQTISDLKVTP